MNDYLTYWQNLAKTTGPEALLEHYASLAETEECKAVLNDIAGKVDSVAVQEVDSTLGYWHKHDLVFVFQDGARLAGCPPAETESLKSLPSSYQKVLLLNNGISFPDENFNMVLNGYHSGETTSNFDKDNWADDVEDQPELLCPVDYYSDYIAYHPTVKASNGEPALAIFDHGNGELEDPLSTDYGLGGLWLRLIGFSVLPGDTRCDILR